jgi:hypothetical protein
VKAVKRQDRKRTGSCDLSGCGTVARTQRGLLSLVFDLRSWPLAAQSRLWSS